MYERSLLQNLKPFFLLALNFPYHVDEILDTKYHLVTYTILHIIIQKIHITVFVNIFNPIAVVLMNSFIIVAL